MRRSAWPLALVFTALFAVPSGGRAQPLVVVDPGHGGADPGAVGCTGLEEAGVVLDVASRLRTLLEAAGLRVTMTRETDVSVGLSARAALANDMGADVFVSNHSNSNAGTPASGTETWVATAASMRSIDLATLLQAAMVAEWGLPDRGVKFADFVVVRDTTMPAALAELAFTNRCTPDAALLADPAARQRMAEAQAGAILEWLGVGPGPGVGTLRGVVFEDQGVGIEDLSVRLPGASVRIVETGASATAASPDGAWSFEMPAGTYSVEASAVGHVTASRTCAVTSGATTWCSVGLLPETAMPDAGAATDAAAATDAGIDAGEPMVRDGASCGCRVGSNGAGSAWAIGLVLAVIAARRRSPWLALVLAGCGTAAAPAAAPLVIAEALVPEVIVELSADAASPVLSEDGAWLLVPSRTLDCLEFVELATGERRVIAEGPRVGLEPRFQADGSVAYRGPEDSATAIPSFAVSRGGQPVPVTLGSHGVHAWVEHGEGEDRVLYRDGATTRVLSPGGDRYLLPSLSGTGWLAYWGAESGVLAVELDTGRTLRIGDPLLETGTFGHPRFDASGRFLVLERTEDDGHAISAAELRLVDLGTVPARRFALALDARARQPSLSRMAQVEGGFAGRIAWAEPGRVVVAAIRVPR
jgi:N-acetylmuramoyl-L-alanine amidase